MELLENMQISLQYGGKPFPEAGFSVSKTREGNVITTVYTHPDGLKITTVAREHPEFNACEWVNWLENTGNAPTPVLSEIWDGQTLLPFQKDYFRPAHCPSTEIGVMLYETIGTNVSEMEFDSPRIDRYWDGVYTQHLQFGEVREIQNEGGASARGRAPFFELRQGQKGYLAAIGWSGQWNCRLERTPEGVIFSSKAADTRFFLKPGEKIRTSSTILMAYEGERCEGHNCWRRFLKQELSPIGKPGESNDLPLSVMIWGGRSTQTLLRQLNRLEQEDLPFQYVWMDAGWYGDLDHTETIDAAEGNWSNSTGDWRVNPYLHPQGLEPVARAVEASGKKFLLWMEPERVNAGTPIDLEHPEYLLRWSGPENKWQNGVRLLNLGDSRAWEYIFETISEKIRRLNLKCFRVDFNIKPLEWWRQNDEPDRQGLTEIRYVMGVYRLFDALRERFPGLLIDDCASGGCRIDTEMMRRSIPLWRSDFTCFRDFPPEQVQGHAVQFGRWLPYSGTAATNEVGDTYAMRSCYSPTMVATAFLYRDPEDLSPEEYEWMRRTLQEYLKVQPYLSEDLYPLIANENDPCQWSATQYHRPEQGDGIVQAFRREKALYSSADLPLKGLSDGDYVFTDADDGSSFVRSGKELKEQGLRVSLPEPRSSKLYFYAPVK